MEARKEEEALLQQEQHTDDYAYLAELRKQIKEKFTDPSAFEEAREEGRNMNFPSAISFALELSSD